MHRHFHLFQHRCVTRLYILSFIGIFVPGSGGKFKAYQPITLYRKFKADGIFNGNRLIQEDHVLVADTEGKIIEVINAADAGDNIEVYEGLLSPGFVNCHCHIELSHLKNLIPPHTGLVDFVQAVMSGREAPMGKKRIAMHSASEELHNSGTVAIGDICNGEDSIWLKNNSNLFWNNFIEVSGFVDVTAQKRMKDAEGIAEKFTVLPFPISIVPHAPYSVSKKLFELLNEKSRTLLTIHNQEATFENDLYKNKTGDFIRLYKNLGIDISGFIPTGKTSFKSWIPYFNKNQKIISVHNTYISQEDIDMAQDVFFCICINANLYIENTLPPVGLLLKNNQNIVLGTDSYASNATLNLVEEMKTIQKNFPSIEKEIILKWATSNGAEALNISHKYGSFDAGKIPGIVLIEKMEEGKFSDSTKAKRLL